MLGEKNHVFFHARDSHSLFYHCSIENEHKNARHYYGKEGGMLAYIVVGVQLVVGFITRHRRREWVNTFRG